MVFIMKYEINYALACNRGKLRGINQDNYWCLGKYLDAANDGLESVESGKTDFENHPAFAVFDGMGGEQYGEIAAHIAATTFDNLIQDKKEKKLPDIKDFLLDSFKQMNTDITAYAKQKLAECVGTTAAMIMFGKKEIYACNIGDSRIYHYDNKNLTRISKDHVMEMFGGRKAPLTQFLGVPETEFIIEPYIAQKSYKDSDCYLVCSDGLTDMLPEDEIKNIIAQNDDIKLCVEILLESALSNGGRDNITIILCKIKKQKTLFGKKSKNNE